MGEYPDDEGTPIPFVKVYGDLIVAPAPTVHMGEDVFLAVELINLGTAPSNQGDQLWASLSFQHTVVEQQHVDFPPIEPNGGTWKHAFKFDGHHVMFEGEWVMIANVTNAGAIGEVQDDQRVAFTVSRRE